MKKIVLTFLLTLPMAQAQSLTFRGDAQHTGTYQTSGPESLTGVKWKFKTSGPVRSTPAVTAEALYFGSNDGIFYAVDCITGKKMWTFITRAPITSSATVHDGKVFFTGFDGFLYALNQQKGTLLWKLQLETKPAGPKDEFDFFTSSPTLDGETLYVGSGTGEVYAVNATTGKALWKTAVQSPVRATPLVVQGEVVVVGYHKNLYRLNARTGKILWTHNMFGYGQSTPTTDGNLFFLGTRGTHSTQAYHLKTGAQVWSFPDSDAWMPASPAYDQGVLFMGSSGTKNLYAINAKNGEKLWQFHTEGFVFSSPAVTPNLVFTGSYDNHVYAIDRQSGQLKWKFNTQKAVVSSPVPFEGELYIGSDDGFLYALH